MCACVRVYIDTYAENLIFFADIPNRHRAADDSDRRAITFRNVGYFECSHAYYAFTRSVIITFLRRREREKVEKSACDCGPSF